eukprot:2338181-Amphidinium_carterae.1
MVLTPLTAEQSTQNMNPCQKAMELQGLLTRTEKGYLQQHTRKIQPTTASRSSEVRPGWGQLLNSSTELSPQPCVAAMEDASNGDTLVPAAPNGDAVAAAPKGDTDLLFIDACDPAETPSLESLAAPPSDDSPAVPAVLNGEDAANVPSCPAPVEGNTVGAPPNGDILTSAEEVAAPIK